MRKAGYLATIMGAALLALAPAAQAETTPPPATPPAATPPEPPKPWYEQKLIPDPFSATIGFQTDYRFRGISQTSLAPSYFGSLDFEYPILKELLFLKDISVYAGVWATNVNFGTAFVEIDVYGGFKGKVTDQLSWNLQFIGYLYPGSGNSVLNYFEVIPAVSYDFGILTLTGGVAISPNYTGGSGFAVWPYADVSIPIPLELVQPYKLAVIAHFGYQAIEKNAKFGAPDYAEWAVGLGATVYGFNLALKYVDTDLRRSECFGGERWCRAGVVFSISKTF